MPPCSRMMRGAGPFASVSRTSSAVIRSGIERQDPVFERPIRSRPNAERSAPPAVATKAGSGTATGRVAQPLPASATIAAAAASAMRRRRCRAITSRGACSRQRCASAILLDAWRVERGALIRNAGVQGAGGNGCRDDQRRERARGHGAQVFGRRHAPAGILPERVDVDQRDRAPHRIVLRVEARPLLRGEKAPHGAAQRRSPSRLCR